ncbi:hypothetical protein T439DRAFT_352979 [Meredithblackwellia eburnea MCA 4105]
MAPKLSPDGRRLRAIIIATPFLVVSSVILYKRLVLGEEQRLLPKGPSEEVKMRMAILEAEREAARRKA